MQVLILNQSYQHGLALELANSFLNFLKNEQHENDNVVYRMVYIHGLNMKKISAMESMDCLNKVHLW